MKRLKQGGSYFHSIPMLQEILTRMDVASMCAAAASCRSLRSAFLEVLPQLQTVHIEDVPPDKRLLEAFLPCNTHLSSLKLDCSRLDDQAIELIAKPHLTELSLVNCAGISSASLVKQIGLCCRALKHLSLDLDPNADPDVVTEALVTLFRNCCLLESFTLRLARYTINDGTFEEMQQLRHLTVLEVASLYLDEAVGMIRVSSFPRLQRLSLVVDQLSDFLIKSISERLPELLQLELWDELTQEPDAVQELTNEGMQYFGLLPKLTRLSVVRSWAQYPASFKAVNDVGIFMMIQLCQRLESIRLGGFSRVTDAGWWAILNTCSKLHTFELMNMPQLTDLTFHNLASTTLGLRAVNLASNFSISDDTVKYLVLCKALEVLNLKGCSNIGDESLKEVASLQELKVLLLDGAHITDAGLRALGKSRMPLVSISLRGCSKLTDNGVVALLAGKLGTTLECIDLSGISKLTNRSIQAVVSNALQVVDLWLRNCALLEEDSVAALASMHLRGRPQATLRLLDLWNCRKLSRECLHWFRKPYFPKLRKLGLSQTEPMDARLLQENRPFLQIHWQGYELGRRKGEGDWMTRTSGRREKPDE